jgi:phospholipase C
MKIDPIPAFRLFRRCLLLLTVCTVAAVGARPAALWSQAQTPNSGPAATPIQHLVVIYQENASFDHYFGTYPNAANPPGEPAFTPAINTPTVNGLTNQLIAHNPNLSQPFRFDRSQGYTCDQDHAYADEQKAYDGGLVDAFVEHTEGKPFDSRQYCHVNADGRYDAVMGHFDGNSVTALWNYAQHFALSDNFFDTTFGQSTAGALHLAAADASGVTCGDPKHIFGDVPPCLAAGASPPESVEVQAPSNGNTGTLYADSDPFWDICSTKSSYPNPAAAFEGRNVGDLLTQAGISWGWFQGGFSLGSAGVCYSNSHVLEAFDRATGVDPATDRNTIQDYVPHHEPFQYFAPTANPAHLEPASASAVGHPDPANHQYDLSWFWQAADANNLPAVSFLKAPQYQNGHPGNSDPLDEQQFLVETINRLQRLPAWSNTAIVIAWDDSDGWYDHVMPPILNHSATTLDTGCGATSDGAPARCGYGPRLPLVVISPFSRGNYVSHSVSDQSSITQFIEDNWLSGQRISATSFDNFAGSLLDLFDFSRPPAQPLFLDPVTGLPTSGP